jgi:prepilin-type N-terminal cleavage/methylation domain-containing protein
MKTHKHKFGVTLIEMVIVVAVIAILASIFIGIASRIDERNKEKYLEDVFTLLESSLQEYHEYWGNFPEQLEKDFTNAPAHSENLYKELNSISDSRKILEKISNSFIKNDWGTADSGPEIYDPWGTALDYIYTPSDNFPELISAGPDKKFGTSDDIISRK